MIINLDTSMIDTGMVIGICIEYKLYTPLIYISTRTDRDFITPLVKMFSEYRSKLIKIAEN